MGAVALVACGSVVACDSERSTGPSGDPDAGLPAGSDASESAECQSAPLVRWLTGFGGPGDEGSVFGRGGGAPTVGVDTAGAVSVGGCLSLDGPVGYIHLDRLEPVVG